MPKEYHDKYISFFTKSNQWVLQEFFPHKTQLFPNNTYKAPLSETNISANDLENISNLLKEICILSSAHNISLFLDKLLTFVDSLNSNKTYVIYGYGAVAKTIERLCQTTSHKLYFVDNDTTKCDNKKVFSKKYLLDLNYDYIIISILHHHDDVYDFLCDLGIHQSKILRIPT